MQNQIAKQFDKKSIKKIIKGALISGTGAIALYLLNWIGALDAGTWTPLIGAMVPFLVNAVKEWVKGV